MFENVAPVLTFRSQIKHIEFNATWYRANSEMNETNKQYTTLEIAFLDM